MMDLAEIRMRTRNRVVRSGVGPLRKPAELLEAYARFGDWVNAHPCDHAFKNRYDIFDYLDSSVLNQGPIDYLEFDVYRSESIWYWSELNRCARPRFFGFKTAQRVLVWISNISIGSYSSL